MNSMNIIIYKIILDILDKEILSIAWARFEVIHR